MTWDYPAIIVAIFVATMLVAIWIMRASTPKRRDPEFECMVCGRIQRYPSAKEWRYCPYCGVPSDSDRLGDLPRRRSILDIPRDR